MRARVAESGPDVCRGSSEQDPVRASARGQGWWSRWRAVQAALLLVAGVASGGCTDASEVVAPRRAVAPPSAIAAARSPVLVTDTTAANGIVEACMLHERCTAAALWAAHGLDRLNTICAAQTSIDDKVATYRLITVLLGHVQQMDTPAMATALRDLGVNVDPFAQCAGLLDPRITGIVVSPAGWWLDFGGHVQMVPTIACSNGFGACTGSIVWWTENAGIAQVAQTGLVTGTGPGVTRVHATLRALIGVAPDPVDAAGTIRVRWPPFALATTMLASWSERAFPNTTCFYHTDDSYTVLGGYATVTAQPSGGGPLDVVATVDAVSRSLTQFVGGPLCVYQSWEYFDRATYTFSARVPGPGVSVPFRVTGSAVASLGDAQGTLVVNGATVVITIGWATQMMEPEAIVFEGGSGQLVYAAIGWAGF